MLRIRQISALLLACALLAGVLCGCGDEDTLVVTLRTMSTLGDEAEYNIYSGLLTEFSELRPEIYVRDTTVPAGDAFRLNAGDEATYKSTDAPHVVYYANEGGLSEISGYLVSIDEIINDYPDFVSGVSIEVLNSMRLEDGKAYCVPAAGEWTALIVNREVFEKAHVKIPIDWNSLIDSCARLSASGVIPIAQTADNCPAVIEALTAAYGGSDAVKLGLAGYSNIVDPYWRSALESYKQLCAAGAFAPAAVTEAITAALTPVSATDADFSAVPESYDKTLGADRDRSLRTDPYKLFNEGLAAMIVLDNDALSGINYTENCQVIRFPSPSGGSASLPGGFRSGFAITRKAYEDPYLRDAAVAFVEYMTSADSCSCYAGLGYLPANSDSVVDGAVGGVCGVRDNDYFVTARSGADLSKWNSINRMAGQLYYGVMTPADICAALSNPELVWVDPNAYVPEPEPVSGSDSQPVSGSDVEDWGEDDWD